MSITVSGDINDMTLVSGSTAKDESVYLTITTDSTNWHIVAKDAMEGVKPSGSAGRLSEYNTTSLSYITNFPKIFTTAMRINGSIAGSVTRTNISVLSDMDQTLQTGTAAVTNQQLPLSFEQVVLSTDPRLSNGHMYRMTVVFTGITDL
jgi:hypothetical protein